MCNITQFVTTTLIDGCNSLIIDQHFIQNDLMNFILYHLVIIDDGTPFKCVFTVICDFLQMKFAVFVEIFYRFFNEIVTIVSNDMDAISIFAEDGINVVF